jgi:hypothetical protein
MTQMAAMSFAREPSQPNRRFVAGDAFQVPPIQQLAIPMQQAFPAGAFNAGHGGNRSGRNVDMDAEGGVVLRCYYMHTTGAALATPSHIVPFVGGNMQLPPVQGVQH